MAGNRVGKTEGGGGYEVVLHLTGDYPDWWPGYRFDHPTSWWAAGDTRETVRDIIQRKLLGADGEHGTGLIPKSSLGAVKMRPNGNGSVDTVRVRHKSGGWSELGFKSYEQGRVSFQGTEKHGIWLDEESDEGIRSECIMRLMTTQGLLIETFTPLKGITLIVKGYMPDGYKDDRVVVTGDRALVMAGWDDAPHLSETDKARMMAECETHLLDARSKGIPSIGSGAIYPVPETLIVVDDFDIPQNWRRVYALDVGWNRTAALWGAHDFRSDTVYLYSEHYLGQAVPAIHAEAVKSRGATIPGVIDPASRGRTQTDGQNLLDQYRSLGLDLTPANNSVESGIYDVWQRMQTGRLKVFRSLQNWRAEYRMYRRDEKGRIVKEYDHLMDATRYLIVSGLSVAVTGDRADLRSMPFQAQTGFSAI
ncbi:MAG: hypothetical protein HGA59_09550 [Chlorobiaceae bacterium]|nr:hypothetical protein [Chlorobiaceae bacterium]